VTSSSSATVHHYAAPYDCDMLRLRPFRRRQLPLTDRWFADADTQRWLGGPGWPGLLLDLHERPLGEYRDAVETGRYNWLAWEGDTPVGYVGCDTYDRCTTWDGSPGGRGVVKTLPVPTANLSYVIDPALRRHGYGTSIVAALLASAQLTQVSLFVAGVEPANTGSISCLLKNGFQPLDLAPDWEGTIYYATEGRRLQVAVRNDDEGSDGGVPLQRLARRILVTILTLPI
jgi:RimJ/RimL family protein N-acetyltransferase